MTARPARALLGSVAWAISSLVVLTGLTPVWGQVPPGGDKMPEMWVGAKRVGGAANAVPAASANVGMAPAASATTPAPPPMSDGSSWKPTASRPSTISALPEPRIGPASRGWTERMSLRTGPAMPEDSTVSAGGCGAMACGRCRPWSDRVRAICVAELMIGPATHGLRPVAHSEPVGTREIPRAMHWEPTPRGDGNHGVEPRRNSAASEAAPALMAPAVNLTIPDPAALPAKPLYETVMAQMLAVLAALTIFCGIVTLAHFFLIRRYGTSILPLFRVEVVAKSPEVNEGPPPAHYPAVATEDQGREAIDQMLPTADEGPIVPNFEIGPTYEEEISQRQGRELHQEQAVLQHIAEMNRQLQDELRELQGSQAEPDAATQAPPPADWLADWSDSADR